LIESKSCCLSESSRRDKRESRRALRKTITNALEEVFGMFRSSATIQWSSPVSIVSPVNTPRRAAAFPEHVEPGVLDLRFQLFAEPSHSVLDVMKTDFSSMTEHGSARHEMTPGQSTRLAFEDCPSGCSSANSRPT
jgi:hypothetical protein